MNNEVYFEKRNKLTEEQKEYIKQNYSKTRTRDIANALNIEYKRVKWYAGNLGLKHEESCYLTWEKVDKLRKRDYYHWEDYMGNTIEPKVDNLYKSKYGKYEVNQHYFDVIDNEFKAYWLGFLYADGCNKISMKNNKHIYEISISLNENDDGHLQKFLNSIQSSTVIKHRVSKNKYRGEYKEFNCCSVLVCNQQLSLSLQEKGCVPNKSLVLKFPTENIVPNDLMRHFIRGYFDGDGHVHINKDNHSINCGFVGTEDFLNGLIAFIKDNTKINTNHAITKDKRSNCYQVHWGSLSDCQQLFKFLYKDSNIYLERKFAKLNNLFCLDI